MMTWWPSTLRARLTLWYVGILTAMLALFGTISVVLLDRALRNNVDASLRSLGDTIAESARRPAFPPPDLQESLESLFGPQLAERLFQLLDPFGRLDPRLIPRTRTRLPITANALRNAGRGLETLETVTLPGQEKAPLRLLTLPVIRNGAMVQIVQVAMSLENVEGTRSRFLLILLSLAPLALAVSALGGWFLARRALAPVDAMVEAARRIEAEDLSERIPTSTSNDELGRLADVLNEMLSRLERSFNAVRQFSADAAHELRTPLTILKGEIEVALRSTLTPEESRQTLVSCLEEVDRLNYLIEDLLLMARMEANALSLPPKLVDLGEVLQEVAPALTALAEARGNICTVTANSKVWIEGYDSLLFRLVFNLAENAIKYTPPGGRVEVRLQKQDSTALLEVEDTGPGIPPEEQERVFTRFYRGDPAREGSGTGLGLALVRSIVQLHKGEITLTSAAGQGSRFRVTLPLAASPPAED
jgi:two-component system OmpR family sensor kinase